MLDLGDGNSVVLVTAGDFEACFSIRAATTLFTNLHVTQVKLIVW